MGVVRKGKRKLDKEKRSDWGMESERWKRGRKDGEGMRGVKGRGKGG